MYMGDFVGVRESKRLHLSGAGLKPTSASWRIWAGELSGIKI